VYCKCKQFATPITSYPPLPLQSLTTLERIKNFRGNSPLGYMPRINTAWRIVSLKLRPAPHKFTYLFTEVVDLSYRSYT